jgi:hypothetical protein
MWMSGCRRTRGSATNATTRQVEAVLRAAAEYGKEHPTDGKPGRCWSLTSFVAAAVPFLVLLSSRTAADNYAQIIIR